MTTEENTLLDEARNPTTPASRLRRFMESVSPLDHDPEIQEAVAANPNLPSDMYLVSAKTGYLPGLFRNVSLDLYILKHPAFVGELAKVLHDQLDQDSRALQMPPESDKPPKTSSVWIQNLHRALLSEQIPPWALNLACCEIRRFSFHIWCVLEKNPAFSTAQLLAAIPEHPGIAQQYLTYPKDCIAIRGSDRVWDHFDQREDVPIEFFAQVIQKRLSKSWYAHHKRLSVALDRYFHFQNPPRIPDGDWIDKMNPIDWASALEEDPRLWDLMSPVAQQVATWAMAILSRDGSITATDARFRVIPALARTALIRKEMLRACREEPFRDYGWTVESLHETAMQDKELAEILCKIRLPDALGEVYDIVYDRFNRDRYRDLIGGHIGILQSILLLEALMAHWNISETDVCTVHSRIRNLKPAFDAMHRIAKLGERVEEWARLRGGTWVSRFVWLQLSGRIPKDKTKHLLLSVNRMDVPNQGSQHHLSVYWNDFVQLEGFLDTADESRSWNSDQAFQELREFNESLPKSEHDGSEDIRNRCF